MWVVMANSDENQCAKKWREGEKGSAKEVNAKCKLNFFPRQLTSFYELSSAGDGSASNGQSLLSVRVCV